MRIILLYILCYFSCSFAFACDCITYDPPEKEIHSSFEGRILAVENVGNVVQIKVQSTKIIKGIKRLKTFIIYENCTNIGCCGIDFKVGQNYLVRTRLIGEREWTDECMGTHTLE